MTSELNPNAVGFCWFNGLKTICIVIWWNSHGYNSYNGDYTGCMQAQICAVDGLSEEQDINMAIKWGGSFPLDIADLLISRSGGWLKPNKLLWRPKAESNSPLKLKLKYKNDNV